MAEKVDRSIKSREHRSVVAGGALFHCAGEPQYASNVKGVDR